MLKTIQRATTIRSLVAAAAAVTIASVAAAPASAWQDDEPLIIGPKIDFGSNWDAFNSQPGDGGRLHWDTTGGVVTPMLSGKLYMENTAAGVHGRLRLDYYDAAGIRLTVRHSLPYAAAAGFNAFNIVNLAPFGDVNVYAVRVETQIEDASGDFQPVGSATETI